MVRGRGQKASEAPRSINEALSELRGLVREQPYDLGRMARLVHQFAPSRQVLLDYIYDFIVDDFMVKLFKLQLKMTPYLVTDQRLTGSRRPGASLISAGRILRKQIYLEPT